MGLFDSLFNRRDRKIRELMIPALAMKLREFVIVDDDPNYVKYYFKFRNKEDEGEEFITVYRRLGSQLHYLSTMSRRAVWGPEFQTLSERGPWSMTITYLIEQGQRLSANTRPTREHFASKVGLFTPPQPTKPEARPVTQPRPAEYAVECYVGPTAERAGTHRRVSKAVFDNNDDAIAAAKELFSYYFNTERWNAEEYCVQVWIDKTAKQRSRTMETTIRELPSTGELEELAGRFFQRKTEDDGDIMMAVRAIYECIALRAEIENVIDTCSDMKTVAYLRDLREKTKH